MSFNVSPGVYDREIDLTGVITAATSLTAGFAGNFQWGPVEVAVPVSSETELVAAFLKPNSTTQLDFLTLLSNLSYPGNILVSRAYDSLNAANAVSGDLVTANLDPSAPGSGILIKNDDHYAGVTIPTTVDWVAKHPGLIGNNLRVYVVASAAALADLKTQLSNATSKADINALGSIASAIGRQAPNTTEFASNLDASNDEVHVFVVDYSGKFTGTPGTILESYLGLSLGANATANDGTKLYYVAKINTSSKFVRWGNHAASFNQTYIGADIVPGADFTPSTPITTLITYVFGGGSDGTYPLTDANYIAAYSIFKNKDIYDVRYLIMGSRTSAVVLDAIQNIAEVRKDCVVFFSPPASAVVGASDPLTNVIEYRDNALTNSSASDTLAGYSSSYAFMDCNWKYMYNKYSNSYVWIPLNGDTAGLAAQTNVTRDAWWPFSGYNRGLVKNAIKLAWNPTELQRDDLYKAQVNPVCSFPGKGVVLFGDKTLQVKPSAFDRVNVRFLFIVLRKSVDEAAKYQLFDFNDQYSRAQFVALVEPFLRDIQGRRGVTDFFVKCDEQNNPPQVVDASQFIGTIAVKPNRSNNFTLLNFVAVPTGVSFDVIEGIG